LGALGRRLESSRPYLLFKKVLANDKLPPKKVASKNIKKGSRLYFLII